MRRLYQPNVKSLRPTAQQQRDFKTFKLEVESAAIMALKANKFTKGIVPFKATIGNMKCLFYPRDQHSIDRAINSFTTTRW